MTTVGVLALQGAFTKHIEVLNSLGVNAIEVRKPEELALCAGVIIPGGESTTIMKQITFIKLAQALHSFALEKPVFGTCAGLILISKEIIGDSMKPFNLIDLSVERNAFGRQVESFHTSIEVNFPKTHSRQVEAIFIRAPRIRKVGPEVQILASYEEEPVFVQQGHHLGATFHPELTSDPAIHKYFIKIIEGMHR